MKPGAGGAARLLLFSCAVGCCLAGSAWGRTWLDKKQGRRIEAVFVRIYDGEVVLQRGNRPLKIPLADLSNRDVEYIRRETESRGKPWLAAPPEDLANGPIRKGEKSKLCSCASREKTWCWAMVAARCKCPMSC